MKRASRKYPKTATEVVEELKKRQTKQDLYVRKMVKQAIDSIQHPDWPMQFSRLEINGQEKKSVVIWECPNCFADGVATSPDHDGSELGCWHCQQCDTHTEFTLITNLQ